MIICDICKSNRADEYFSLPINVGYCLMKESKTLMKYTKLEKREQTICENCQRKIANFIEGISVEHIGGDD